MDNKVKANFIQACINHSCLNLEKVNQILNPICEAYEIEAPQDAKSLRSLVAEINNDLKKFNQALTFIKHPLLCEEFLVFGFTFEMQVLKHNPLYSDADRNYFGKLLEIMVSQEDYGIDKMEVYSVESLLPLAGAGSQKPLAKNRIQDLVLNWTQQGYFVEKDEMLYLGPRMMVEFATYLKTHFPDTVKDCPLCSKLVLWDIKCSDCGVRIHHECLRKYLTKRGNCPQCKCIWNTRLSSSQ